MAPTEIIGATNKIMKIIGSKDYYDYGVGQYGIDPHVVLDRRDGFRVELPSCYEYHNEGNPARLERLAAQIEVAFCGKLYRGCVTPKNGILWGDQLLELGGQLVSIRGDISKGRDTQKIYLDSSGIITGRRRVYERDYIRYQTLDTKVNEKYGNPILYRGGTSYDYRTEGPAPEWTHPWTLADLRFTTVFSADDAYKEIYNWILMNKTDNNHDILSDKSKITSKGFDDKQSFRHRRA